ncbi:MAG: hypothetical protein M3O33_14605 [Cyanobacteriota bacterium]|nr:hypothetical protein [Cyanobacteriota bacterium]
MTKKTIGVTSYVEKPQMIQDKRTKERQGIETLLSSLTLEVDNIFFSLRKADQIIRRELNLLNQQNFKSFKKTSITPINEEKLREIIEAIPIQHLLLDEYIIYMLKNDNNSIFKLIKEYNSYLDKRKIEEVDNNKVLRGIDEKLVYYIRHLGAMTYHLNIHLNLLNVLIRNASGVADSQQTAIKASKEIVMEYMVKEWGEQQRDVKFLEITIDEPYAIVTWALEDLSGDAILLQDEGFWQLINISAGTFSLEDFENADVPLEVAQRMLKLHHHKLGY